MCPDGPAGHLRSRLVLSDHGVRLQGKPQEQLHEGEGGRINGMMALVGGGAPFAWANANPALSICTQSIMAERTDWFKRAVDILTLIVLVAGFWMAIDQAKKLNETIAE